MEQNSSKPEDNLHLERISLRIFALLVLLSGIVALIWIGQNPPGQMRLFPKCAFFELTGYYCPGCGGTRSVHSLMNLEIFTAMKQNLIFVLIGVPFFAYFGFSLAKLTFFGKWKSPMFGGAKAGWLLVIAVILFWILRNVPVSAFDVLRPT